MAVEDRLALHQRLSDGIIDAYRSGVERGGIVYPEEWVLAEDMIFWSPTLGKGIEFPYAKEIAAAGLTLAQAATLEAQYIWSKLPNFRAVGPAGNVIVNASGFAQWWSFEGTAEDGRVYRLHEADFISTNESGQVSRWEAFLDWTEMKPLLQLLSGRTFEDGIALEDYLALIGEYHAGRVAG